MGAVAVVVSLIYVAVQVRHNTKWVKAQTFESVVGRLIDWHVHSQDPELARVFLEGCRNFDQLTAEDQLRFGRLGGEQAWGRVGPRVSTQEIPQKGAYSSYPPARQLPRISLKRSSKSASSATRSLPPVQPRSARGRPTSALRTSRSAPWRGVTAIIPRLGAQVQLPFRAPGARSRRARRTAGSAPPRGR